MAQIGKCSSVSDAWEYFYYLFDIQGRIAIMIFKYQIDIWLNLKDMTREFDCL
jgi:hypothetical protein